MRRSVSFEVAGRGAIIFVSFVYRCLRNTFDLLSISLILRLTAACISVGRLLQNAPTAIHIPSDVGCRGANLRLPQSNEGLL